MDYYKKCKNITIDEIKKREEYTFLPLSIKRKAAKLKSKKELCKLLAVAIEANKEGSSREFFRLLEVSNQISSLLSNPHPPKKFLKTIKPSYRFFHGRSVTRSAQIWKTAKSFKRVMWWAVERYTPLLYASTSIKGRQLDTSLRWDLYEARVKQNQELFIISKESIKWILDNIAYVKCEGRTLGSWIKEAFPIVNGKLKRESYIASDRSMAKCLCENVGTVGYLAPEIPVHDGVGRLHREAMFCNPAKYLKLKKYSVFTTKKSQKSVEDFLNERGTRVTPDIVKEFK